MDRGSHYKPSMITFGSHAFHTTAPSFHAQQLTRVMRPPPHCGQAIWLPGPACITIVNIPLLVPIESGKIRQVE